MTTQPPAEVKLAQLWRRVLARLLDQVIIGVPVVLVVIATGVRSVEDLSDQAVEVNVALVLVTFVYEFVLIGVWGRTVGKVALRTRAVRVDTSGSVPWSSSAIRALVPLAAGVIPGIGQLLTLIVYGAAFVDRNIQGLHDKAAGTIVVLTRLPATATR